MGDIFWFLGNLNEIKNLKGWKLFKKFIFRTFKKIYPKIMITSKLS